MKFEQKISGTRVTDYKIEKMLFHSQFISLKECLEKVKRQETMDWLLDTLRFTKSEDDWYAIIDWDSILKLSVLEYYPQYEEELKNYFGESWLKHYIRFGH